MPQLGCFAVILLLIGLHFLIEYINKCLGILYLTFTPIQLKALGTLVAIVFGIYFLRPVYYIYSGKLKEKLYLEQLKKDLSNNDRFRKHDIQNLSQLPPVIKKIALITSEKSAGFSDFKERLYCGDFTLFHTTMNENYPDNVIDNIISNINLINTNSSIDVICITRGGGNNLDFIFNAPELANAIQNSKIPVLLGVGHSTDISLCDHVSFCPIENGEKRYFTTPTDLAYFFNEYNQKQLLRTNEKLMILGPISAHIKFKPLIFYVFILYTLYSIFWTHLYLK